MEGRSVRSVARHTAASGPMCLVCDEHYDAINSERSWRLDAGRMKHYEWCSSRQRRNRHSRSFFYPSFCNDIDAFPLHAARQTCPNSIFSFFWSAAVKYSNNSVNIPDNYISNITRYRSLIDIARAIFICASGWMSPRRSGHQVVILKRFITTTLPCNPCTTALLLAGQVTVTVEKRAWSDNNTALVKGN